MLSFSERVAAYRRAPVFYRRELPLICFVYLGLARFAAHDLRPEHVLAVVIALTLAAFSDGSRKLARVGLPFILWVSVYDSMRWYADAIRSPVIHVHEPYDFDLRFFGIGGQTPNEWLQKHTAGVLDFFCGLAYTPFFFVGESVLLAIWMQFHGMERRAERFAWVFVIANFVGFSFYYFYPAAPPWYVADHGFLVDLSVRASPAGTVRFDQLVGVPIMQGFYSKSADVFGAIPSLHIVYPFLALVYSIRLRRFRFAALAYWLLVCFSAVYLNHHYLLDIFVGLGIAISVSLAFRALFGAVERAPVPARVPVPAGEPA
jgi:membrane-associated phospholipid phosphatase